MDGFARAVRGVSGSQRSMRKLKGKGNGTWTGSGMWRWRGKVEVEGEGVGGANVVYGRGRAASGGASADGARVIQHNNAPALQDTSRRGGRSHSGLYSASLLALSKGAGKK